MDRSRIRLVPSAVYAVSVLALLLPGLLRPASATEYEAKSWYRAELLDLALGWPPVGVGVARFAVGLPPPCGLGAGLELFEGQGGPAAAGMGVLGLSVCYVAYAKWDARGSPRPVVYAEALGALIPYWRIGVAADWQNGSFPLILGLRAGLWRGYDSDNDVWYPLGFYAQVRAGLGVWRGTKVHPVKAAP